MKTTNIKFAFIYSEFDDCLEKFEEILKQIATNEAKSYLEKLKLESKSIRDNPVLKIAFIGQYSAGKSTIIRALTGNEKIKVGAGITTEKATAYVWQGIKLIDTPGIGTERLDHDMVTYDAIKQADLLVFCTTHMLFDNHLVKHFKNLAFEKHYSHKMMLIFNKLSAEAGDDEEKIANYCRSINQALSPHSINEFLICFLDAKDYCEGLEDNDEELIKLSRFSNFINVLNKFIKDNDKLAQLDTPIRRVLEYINEVENSLRSDPEREKIFVDTLNRLSRKVREAEQRLDLQVKKMFLEESTEVFLLKNEFINNLTQFKSEDDIKQYQNQLQCELQKIWNALESGLQERVTESVNNLESDIRDILDSPIIADFVAKFDSTTQINVNPFSKGLNIANLSNQVKFLQNIAEKVGMQIANQSVRNTLQIGTEANLLNTVGSPLHQQILQGGKFIGFKFKPFQAVKIARNVGDFAKFVGPVLGLASIVLDTMDAVQEENEARKFYEVKSSLEKEFNKIAEAMEEQLYIQLNECKFKIFEELNSLIGSKRQDYDEQARKNANKIQDLGKLKQKLELLIQSLA